MKAPGKERRDDCDEYLEGSHAKAEILNGVAYFN